MRLTLSFSLPWLVLIAKVFVGSGLAPGWVLAGGGRVKVPLDSLEKPAKHSCANYASTDLHLINLANVKSLKNKTQRSECV